LGRNKTSQYETTDFVTQGIKGDYYQVSCGAAHSVVLSEKGVYAWGLNDEGQCTGSKQEIELPFLISQKLFDDRIITYVSCGAHHTIAIGDGQGYAWGWNMYGQCAAPQNAVTIHSPRPIEKIKNAETAACGNSHSMIKTANQLLYVFGSNGFGELGNESTKEFSCEPIKLDIAKVAHISAGCYNSAVTTHDVIYIWGRLMGFGFASHQFTPRKIDVSNVLTVGCGFSHIALLISKK